MTGGTQDRMAYRARLVASDRDPVLAFGYEPDGGRTVAVYRLGILSVADAAAETFAASGKLAWASLRFVVLPRDPSVGVLSEVLAVAASLGLGVLVGSEPRLEPVEAETDWYSVSLLAPEDPKLAGVLAERAELYGRPTGTRATLVAAAEAVSPREARVEGAEPERDEVDAPAQVSVLLSEMLSGDGPPVAGQAASLSVPPVAVLARDGRHHAIMPDGTGSYVIRERGVERPVGMDELSGFMSSGGLSLVGVPGDELAEAISEWGGPAHGGSEPIQDPLESQPDEPKAVSEPEREPEHSTESGDDDEIEIDFDLSGGQPDTGDDGSDDSGEAVESGGSDELGGHGVASPDDPMSAEDDDSSDAFGGFNWDDA